MRTVIIAISIMVIVVAVLFILPFAIMFFSYIFGIDMNEQGNLLECIGCPVNDKRICEHNCNFVKRIRRKNEREKRRKNEREERRKRKNATKRRRQNKKHSYLH